MASRNKMISLSEKEYNLLLETIQMYSKKENWNFNDCVCLSRSGGFWVGPGIGPSLAIEALEIKKQN